MIRVRFSLTEKGIRDFLDNKGIWNNATVKKDGDKVIYCFADIDSNHIDDEGYDCYFYVQKPKEQWENYNIKPKLMFRGRTIIMYNKWKAQFKEFLHKVDMARDEAKKHNDMKDIL